MITLNSEFTVITWLNEKMVPLIEKMPIKSQNCPAQNKCNYINAIIHKNSPTQATKQPHYV